MYENIMQTSAENFYLMLTGLKTVDMCPYEDVGDTNTIKVIDEKTMETLGTVELTLLTTYKKGRGSHNGGDRVFMYYSKLFDFPYWIKQKEYILKENQTPAFYQITSIEAKK